MYAGISDLIDGEISRRIGSTSRFGERLDPIADKVVVLAVIGTLLWEGSIQWWEMILVAMRDFVVLGIAAIVAWQHWTRPMETTPLIIGKIATGGQFAYVLTILLAPQLSTFVLIPTAFLSCSAAVAYTQDAIQQKNDLEE